jgi:UDP-N-acetylmuramoyl-L-alanyl-D-glutamate--2,6-diaminopimelate ligase
MLILDRRAAIATALEQARPGDVVLFAGKGHERSIIGPAGPAPWHERAEVESALAALGYAEA